MNASAALLPFDVRPAHRETLDSYSNRLLAANFCDDRHRNDLSRAFATDRSADAMRDGWMRALTTKTKRTTLHLTPDLTSRLFDGRSECTHFQNTLPRRFACTHCTHGATVEQYPHFDDIVCIRHGRWTGLWTHADRQQQTTPDAVKAQILFAKLRRKNLIDVRLYLLTTKALARALHPSLPIEQAEPLVFPQVIGLIHAITADTFARRFFDPALPFTDAHSHLDAVVTATIGHASPTVVRSLWIYMHPTVLTLNNAILLNTPHTADWVHDYPLRPGTAATLATFGGELEPVENYLIVTGDTPGTAAAATATLSSLNTTQDTIVRSFTCANGHSFDYCTPADLPGTMTPTMYTPACGSCTNRRVRPGENDLETMHPNIALQFDLLRNGGLTAADVAASSSTTHAWICPSGHSHNVSPSKKTLPTYNCPVCSTRVVRRGVNCLLSAYPDIAAMWAQGWAEDCSPATIATGSNYLGIWRCPLGHLFHARFWELASGKRSCNSCFKSRTLRPADTLAVTHPAVAARLHPTLNDGLTAENLTHGQDFEAWWLCTNGKSDHEYQARVDKVTAGLQCTICGSRKLKPGENDLATVEPILSLELHPYLNRKAADEMFPSDHKLWWRCHFNSHKHQQTTQNRRQSKGCPRCKPGERILVYTSVA